MARFLNRSGAGRGRSLKGIAPAPAALLVLASSVQAGLSAPGTGSSTTAPSTAMPPGRGLSGMPMGQRSADAHFIVMMIPHHEGAIAMAELALQRSKRPEIRAMGGEDSHQSEPGECPDAPLVSPVVPQRRAHLARPGDGHEGWHGNGNGDAWFRHQP